MKSLNENKYNRRAQRHEQKLKLWKNAGIILTYRCNAECEFCYYHCGPNRTAVMEPDTALEIWKSLIKLAGNDAKIHLTGGEPFLCWDNLKIIIGRANKEIPARLDLLETNAFWAVDNQITTQRMKFLADNGLKRLKISWDPFHAPFVDIECVRRAVTIANEYLGQEAVQVRWQYYLDNPPDTNISEEELLSQMKSSHQKFPMRFTGRAAGILADFCADKNTDINSYTPCRKAFLNARGVHIDPYGNVFNGTCSGVIIGNINDEPLDEIWANFDPANMEFISDLFHKGPAGLLEKATKPGYKKRRFYAGKCHLCTHLRNFFFDNGYYKRIIGPADCYQTEADKKTHGRIEY